MSDLAIFACAFFFVAGFATAEIWAYLRIVMLRRRIQCRLRKYWGEQLIRIKLIQ